MYTHIYQAFLQIFLYSYLHSTEDKAVLCGLVGSSQIVIVQDTNLKDGIIGTPAEEGDRHKANKLEIKRDKK